MAVDKKKVNVAIVGLGRVGSTFLAKLAEREGQGVSIVAAALGGVVCLLVLSRLPWMRA